MVYVDHQKEEILNGEITENPNDENGEEVTYNIGEEEDVELFFENIYAEISDAYPNYILGYDNYYTLSREDSELKLVSAGFISSDLTATYCAITINKLDTSVNALSFVKKLRSLVSSYTEKYIPDYFSAVLGIDSMFLEIMNSTGKDVVIMVALSLPFAFLIIGVYLKSAKLILFPLLVVILAALISLGISALMPLTMDVLPFVPGMQAAILLAMSIDYTLFISSALKRELLLGKSLVSVIYNVLITGGKIVLVSGTLLLVTLLSVCCMGNALLISIGLGMAICLVVIVLIGPLLQMSMLMLWPNFFGSYSFNISSTLVFATEEDINTFKINPKVIARTQKILDKKVLIVYNSEGRKVKLTGKDKNAKDSSSSSDQYSDMVSPSEKSLLNDSEDTKSKKGFGTNSSQNSSSKITSKKKSSTSSSDIVEDMGGSLREENISATEGMNLIDNYSENERDGEKKNSASGKQKVKCIYFTEKMKYKHSFRKGDRPRIDRVPNEKERIQLQKKDLFFKIAQNIVKLPIACVVIVICILLLAPGIYGLIDIAITYDNLETIPKGSSIVNGITTYGYKFSQGFVFPFVVLLSPIDDNDMEINVVEEEVFNLSVKMIEEIIEGVNDEELLNGSLVMSPAYLAGNAIPAEVAKMLLDSDGSSEHEIANQIVSAYQYVCSMYLTEDKRAMQLFLAPNIPWSAIGSDDMTITIRNVLTSTENAQQLQKLGLRADLFSMYADLMDSGNSIFAVFPILAVVIVILLCIMVGIIYKSLIVPVKLLITLAIILVFTFGICSLIFNSHEGYYWFVPSATLPIVIGLATDYDTFLYTTVFHKRSIGINDKDSAVAAIYDSGKTIVAAGLIMATSFIGLAFSSVEVMMQLGTILVIAVLFEAIIIIPLFVPSLTSLFGKIMWLPHHMPEGKYDSFYVAQAKDVDERDSYSKEEEENRCAVSASEDINRENLERSANTDDDAKV